MHIGTHKHKRIPSPHANTLLNPFGVKQGEELWGDHPWTNVNRLSQLLARFILKGIVINFLPCVINKPPSIKPHSRTTKDM